jgi:hypothetical protein
VLLSSRSISLSSGLNQLLLSLSLCLSLERGKGLENKTGGNGRGSR